MPSPGPGVAGRRAFAPGSRRGAGGILDRAGVPTVVHAFTDGRDTPPRSAGDDIARFSADAAGVGVDRHGVRPLLRHGPRQSLGPRQQGLRCDRRWRGAARFADAESAIADAYARDISDEFVVPAVIGSYRGMRDGDGVLCFNFRADRVREILAALLDPASPGFPRTRVRQFAAAAGMTQYSDAARSRSCARSSRRSTLRERAGRGRRQRPAARSCAWPRRRSIRTSPISSTAAARRPMPGEDRIMVPSPKVATYDLQPEMSAPELTDKAVEAIRSGKYDLIVLNYANPDMVGHTGILAAAIKAVETVDAGPRPDRRGDRKAGGALLVTADHGNCEMMRDPETGGPHTAHTTNPVPVVLLGGGEAPRWRTGGWRTWRRRCSS